jgi:hypothetical protein
MDVVVANRGWCRVRESPYPFRSSLALSRNGLGEGLHWCSWTWLWTTNFNLKQQNLDRVCWVLVLTEECWFPSWTWRTLFTCAAWIGPQSWSGLRFWSRRVKIGSSVALPVIIFLDFFIFGFWMFYPFSWDLTLLYFLGSRGHLSDHRQRSNTPLTSHRPWSKQSSSTTTSRSSLGWWSLDWTNPIVSKFSLTSIRNF